MRKRTGSVVVESDDTKYRRARAEAQQKADTTGFDYGIERNAFGFSVFMLPQKQNRYGHELSCEVVSAMDLNKCQKGHGPRAEHSADCICRLCAVNGFQGVKS